MLVSTAVMTHPVRRQFADQLAAAHPDLAPQIVLDPDPDGAPSALRTAQLAWSAAPAAATHHLVLQDDVQGVVQLGAHVRAAVRAVPDRPLVFFTEWGSRTAQAVRIAALLGYEWSSVPDRLHTSQAVLLPAALARQFVEHLAALGPGLAGLTNDADVLFGFLRDRGAEPLIAVTNLVEHIEIPSLVGNSVLRGPRRSPCWDPDLPERIWDSREMPELGVMPYFSTREARSYCEIRSMNGVRSMQTVDWLVDRGLAQKDAIAHFAEALGRLGAGVAVRATLADTMLFELWATALATGAALAHAHSVSSGGLGAALMTQSASRAWTTFVPGSMRKILPEPLSRRVGVALTPMLSQALADGARLNECVRAAW